MSAAFCEMRMVDARRRRGGSSISSAEEDEEYERDGTEVPVFGSSGMQWVVVIVRIGEGRDMMKDESMLFRSIYTLYLCYVRGR